MHYAEPAWDLRRINNINQHFVTAFLGVRLKKLDYASYLDLPQQANGEGDAGSPQGGRAGAMMGRGHEGCHWPAACGLRS